MIRLRVLPILALSVLAGCGAGKDDVGTQSDAMPRVVAGNPQSCAEILGSGMLTLKIDPAVSGTYTSADGKLTVKVTATEKTFDFTASIGVDAVIVKGGPAANVYEFSGEVMAGVTLVAPDMKGLSHLMFCYDLETPPPPPSTQPPVQLPPPELPPPPEEPCDDGEC